MSIQFYKNSNTIKMDTRESTYLIGIANGKYVGHMYYGRKIRDYDIPSLLGTQRDKYLPEDLPREKVAFEDTYSWELGMFGQGDFREPCIEIEKDGKLLHMELFYVKHDIFKGKRALKGLPSTFGSIDDCETLELTLEDHRCKIKCILRYSVFPETDVITRSMEIINTGNMTAEIKRAFSCCLDFQKGEYDLLTLHGAWGRERKPYRREIGFGKQGISSLRGVSSHQENPFMALLERGATEDYGNVYGLNFVYSGNFIAQVEKNQFGRVRAVMGIHPMQFSWKLAPGEMFTAPEVVMVFSPRGMKGMTHRYHDMYRNHLLRGKYKDARRPILINNWEATYFDFSTDKLLEIGKKASELGIELLVMDDGWFGKRDDDNSSLGDWKVNEKKLPGGLSYLAEQLNKMGVKFGIWVEPEMISPDSDLYREHPEWALQDTKRAGSLSRNQLVLDFSRQEVIDAIYNQISSMLKSANIEYVKWDMNRALTNVTSQCGTRQGELYHRYVLGVYDLQDRLTRDFPDILLENCSSGGGRFDPGMLYYSPQIWCSDDTDALERLSIQRGTAMVYPMSTMGAHVSDCPNHVTKRTTPFATRGIVAMAGTFGYELDITKITEEQQEEIRDLNRRYITYHNLVREGDYYFLVDDEENHAYMVVSKDRKEALVTHVCKVKHPMQQSRHMPLKGLNESSKYCITEDGSSNAPSYYYGDTLMNIGLEFEEANEDYEARIFYLREE